MNSFLFIFGFNLQQFHSVLCSYSIIVYLWVNIPLLSSKLVLLFNPFITSWLISFYHRSHKYWRYNMANWFETRWSLIWTRFHIFQLFICSYHNPHQSIKIGLWYSSGCRNSRIATKRVDWVGGWRHLKFKSRMEDRVYINSDWFLWRLLSVQILPASVNRHCRGVAILIKFRPFRS